jgi:hypothetical protein
MSGGAMTAADSLTALRALQNPDGGFASVVESGRGRDTDFNGFVTAIVLRMLRHLPDMGDWITMRDRALDWLWSCRSSRVPGAFTFWPDKARPRWASTVPPDVDDTAIMLTELLRHGRLNPAAALRSVCRAIVPCRVRSGEIGTLPPWIVPECFVTWIADATDPAARKPVVNVVDCCVNVNVIALMSQLNARHLPGYDAGLRTVVNGLQWAGDDEKRLASLTPFYPSAQNMADAMEHAVYCGVEALRDPLRRLIDLSPNVLRAQGGVCRSAYGGTIWYASAIELARSVAAQSSPYRP